MLDATLLALQKNLDMRSIKHAVHTSNIANANVPEYKARKVEFQEALKLAIEADDGDLSPDRLRQSIVSNEVGKVTETIFEDPNASVNGDGNSVNVDKEMSEIAKNTLGYETGIQLIKKKIALYNTAISEGAK